MSAADSGRTMRFLIILSVNSDIAMVEGVDMILIGTNDLSAEFVSGPVLVLTCLRNTD